MHSILLVRHAETTLNARRTVQYPDTPLSTHGHWQAQRLADRLREEGVTRVVSSDYTRAEVTARAICQVTRASLTIEPMLRERHLGALRGRPYLEVGGLVFSEAGDPEAGDPETGERWVDFVDRIDRVWAWVLHQTQHGPGVLAVVTHGLVCRALAVRHLSLPPSDTPPSFPNASVTVVEPRSPCRVSMLASESHLQRDDGSDDILSTTERDLSTR